MRFIILVKYSPATNAFYFFANTGLYIIQQEQKDSYTTRTFSTQQSTAVQMISEPVTLIVFGGCATKLVVGGWILIWKAFWHTSHTLTVCPRCSDPFYIIVSYYVTWVTNYFLDILYDITSSKENPESYHFQILAISFRNGTPSLSFI